MNKNILWGSVIVVGVVLVVWLIVSKGNSPVQNVNTEDTTKSVVTEKPAVKSVASKPVSVAPTETFTNILPKLGNYQCDYEEVTQSTRSTNTVYLSDGRMRAEFRSRTADGSTNSIMVYDGYNLYTWTEGKSTGTVTHPKYLSDFPAIIPKEIVAAKVLGSGLFNASWSCHPWSKDASMLVKPSYLKV
jgi:hypothetical protein